MLTITNAKIAGLMPIWANFKGFSLLFDNPGDSFIPLQTYQNFQQIHCDCTDPALEMYKSVTETLATFEQLFSTYFLCPLPPSSYHVTVWDGLNDGNVSDVARYYRFEAEDFVRKLPKSLETASDFIRSYQEQPLTIEMDKPLTFAFAGLKKWNNNALVARLQPIDQDSQNVFERIVHERSMLLNTYEERFGLQTASCAYLPHISLGYFANKEQAELASPQVARWEKLFRKHTKGKTITFQSLSLYGFTDMATFFKR